MTQALTIRVPEFASGQWMIRKGKVRRMFLKDNSGCWEGLYTLSCVLPDRQEQEVRLHGKIIAPGMGEPEAQVGASQPFGSPDWHSCQNCAWS